MAFQAAQWPAFEEGARRQLEFPLEGMQLLIWRYPAFGQFTTWQLNSCQLLRLIWRRPRDTRMVSQPLEGVRRGPRAEPTIESASSPISPELHVQVWETLKRVQIPLVKSSMITLDGVQQGVQAPGAFRLDWNSLPDSWQPLQNWLDETVDWWDEML